MEPDLQSSLSRVEARLAAIERNTKTSWRELLLSGFLRGVGVVMGTAITIAFAGWGLAFLGIVPGAEDIAAYVVDAISDSNFD